jgi:hypothetical protein
MLPSPDAPFEWAVSSGGTASSIAPDGAGGAFVTGIFSGRQLFGSTTLEGYNSYDTFLMHVTALGAIDWAIQGNMSDSFGRSLTHDGAGGALVTGCFSGSSAPARAYVMHVMRSGVIDWVAVAGGKSFDNAYFTAGTSNLAQGTGIVSDGAGGALVTGWFSGVASFGSTSLESRGDLDVFVMHVTASGAIDWAVQAGGTVNDDGLGIASDGAGGALVTGAFTGKALFGTTLLGSRGSKDVFVMHVTTSGAIGWAVRAGGTFDDQGHGIAYDGAGGALVTGWFSGEASFGNSSIKSHGDFDVFAMHVTASGAIDWVVQAGGTSDDSGNGIASDGAGGALVTGTFNGAASFGSTTLETVSRLRGDYDGFVMHVTASGVIDWARSTGGTLNAWGNGIAQRDEVGGFLVTGTFMGNVSLGSSTIAGQPLQINSFAASLMPPPPPPPLPPPPSPPVNSGFSWFTSVIDPSLAVVLLFACALLLW